jgi:hypothetical protein
LPRAASVVVTFTKPGCKQALVSVFPTVSGGGMLWGGVLGEMSGADYDLQPNPAVATLECTEQPAVGAIAPSPATGRIAQGSAPAVAAAHDDPNDHF